MSSHEFCYFPFAGGRGEAIRCACLRAPGVAACGACWLPHPALTRKDCMSTPQGRDPRGTDRVQAHGPAVSRLPKEEGGHKGQRVAERYAHALKLFFMRRTRLRAMRRARLLLVSQPPSHSLTRAHTPSLSPPLTQYEFIKWVYSPPAPSPGGEGVRPAAVLLCIA